MTIKERIIEAIENLSSDEAVSLWNEYCSEDDREDDGEEEVKENAASEEKSEA